MPFGIHLDVKLAGTQQYDENIIDEYHIGGPFQQCNKIGPWW